ncbi:uncharacterized protein [Oscarella lobularis]|uniref:uncharacterized protein n=1 Tax=Oscarella lobularis TaxID=121494 RepID=UPI003313551C
MLRLLTDSRIRDATEGDRAYTCIRFGGMIFRHSLQMRYFKLVCFAYVFKVWLFNPFVPLVFTFLCRTSSSYTTLIKMTERMYPRFDADIPSWEKASLINVVKCLQPMSTLVCTIQKRALHLSADLVRISEKIGLSQLKKK